MAPPSILVYEHSQLGPILTDAEGYVLYRLEFDLPGAAPVDHASWPAVWDVDSPIGGSGISAALETGSEGFLTIEGYPVYRYAEDVFPGDATGHGAGSVWWTIHPDGSLNQKTGPGVPDGPDDPPPGEPGDPPPPPPPSEPGGPRRR